MKILFLSRWFPYPSDNGSKLRIHNLLHGLSQHHEVTLLSFADQAEVELEAADVRSVYSDAHFVPWKEFNPHSWRARLGFISFKPRSVVDTFSPEMAQKINWILKSQDYNLVIASQLPMAAYYPYFKGVPALFEELEIGLSYQHFHHSLDWKNRLRHAFTWFKLHIYLSQLLKFFRAVTVVSEQEEKLVARSFPNVKNIQVIPNCMNMDDYQEVHAEPKPNTLIFTGSFRYHANYEAMLWFTREVFPLILEQVPDAQLIITGDHTDLLLPSSKGVFLTGYVRDIKSLIASSTVSVAPLLSGGGTRLKILEAMALGTPVVATSKGVEGLDARNDEHLLVSDMPVEFARHVIKLLHEKDFRHRLAMNASRFVRENYDWRKIMPKYLKVVEQVTGSRLN